MLRSTRISVPVISVGNLTMGGTGKTPIVEMLARKIAQQGLPTAILARGYGKIDPSQDDENLLFDIDHVIRLTGANRVESAKRAIEEFQARAIILDDGYQHFQIQRDLDILVVDDEGDIRDLVSGVLEDEGYEISWEPKQITVKYTTPNGEKETREEESRRRDENEEKERGKEGKGGKKGGKGERSTRYSGIWGASGKKH